eukprot:3928943-Amphidinium_carterae.1
MKLLEGLKANTLLQWRARVASPRVFWNDIRSSLGAHLMRAEILSTRMRNNHCALKRTEWTTENSPRASNYFK